MLRNWAENRTHLPIPYTVYVVVIFSLCKHFSGKQIWQKKLSRKQIKVHCINTKSLSWCFEEKKYLLSHFFHKKFRTSFHSFPSLVLKRLSDFFLLTRQKSRDFIGQVNKEKKSDWLFSRIEIYKQTEIRRLSFAHNSKQNWNRGGYLNLKAH